MEKTDLQTKDHLRAELHDLRKDMEGVSNKTSLWQTLAKKEEELIQKLKNLGVHDI